MFQPVWSDKVRPIVSGRRRSALSPVWNGCRWDRCYPQPSPPSPLLDSLTSPGSGHVDMWTHITSASSDSWVGKRGGAQREPLVFKRPRLIWALSAERFTVKVTGRGMEGGRVSPVSVLGILTSSIGNTSALVSVTSGHLSPPFFWRPLAGRTVQRRRHGTRLLVIRPGCYTHLNLGHGFWV